jgi:8-oxo-dGTP pyrophosphatase MutT (NUDIX family)
MLQFLVRYENCFERSLEVGHVTGSAWLLNADHSKALVMHHTKLDRWFQLGGHCDGNHDVLAVALKEAGEESGMVHIQPVSQEIFDIDIHLIPPKGNLKAHYHYDVRFLLEAAGNETVMGNCESKELRWIGPNENELPTDSRSVVRMFDKWRRSF